MKFDKNQMFFFSCYWKPPGNVTKKSRTLFVLVSVTEWLMRLQNTGSDNKKYSCDESHSAVCSHCVPFHQWADCRCFFPGIMTLRSPRNLKLLFHINNPNLKLEITSPLRRCLWPPSRLCSNINGCSCSRTWITCTICLKQKLCPNAQWDMSQTVHIFNSYSRRKLIMLWLFTVT